MVHTINGKVKDSEGTRCTRGKPTNRGVNSDPSDGTGTRKLSITFNGFNPTQDHGEPNPAFKRVKGRGTTWTVFPSITRPRRDKYPHTLILTPMESF